MIWKNAQPDGVEEDGGQRNDIMGTLVLMFGLIRIDVDVLRGSCKHPDGGRVMMRTSNPVMKKAAVVIIRIGR